MTECKKWIEIIGVQTVQAMGSIVMASAENICHDLGCTPEIFWFQFWIIDILSL